MANDETGIRLFSSTEKDNTSNTIIPRITMLIPGLLFQGKELTRPMGWVLHTCTYVGNLPIDIPLFSKIGTVGKPAIREEMEYMQKCEELWVLIW